MAHHFGNMLLWAILCELDKRMIVEKENTSRGVPAVVYHPWCTSRGVPDETKQQSDAATIVKTLLTYGSANNSLLP